MAMETVRVEQVVITHDHAWGKWPDTRDTDYAPVLARRWVGRYRRGDAVVEVTSRFLPAYLGHVRAGVLELPAAVRFPAIDNTVPPAEAVRAAQRALLAEAARDCRVVVWDHAHQCFPDVACALPGLFRLAILPFADDCPGSSEVKTFPVARYFDALYHQMLVWDDRTGARVADKYRALGLPYARFLPQGTTAGLREALADAGFDLAAKAARVASGELTPQLVFVGFVYRDGSRRGATLADLAARRGELAAAGVPVRMHGVGAPDGELLPRQVALPGRVFAPLYAGATFGVNAPVSSIFNSRLFDLWTAGVAQLVDDRHGELAELGFLPGEHFLPFDGTFDGLRDAVLSALARPDDLAGLIARAHAAAEAFVARHNPTSAYADIYHDHLERLR